MEIALIAAVSENRVIGYNGQIPWETIPEDMKAFRSLTISDENNAVIMGRKTWKTIPSSLRPLEKRLNIVLTSREDFTPSGVYVARDLEEALKKCKQMGKSTAYIIGGQKPYEEAINLADRLEITEIKKAVEGDAFFPQIDRSLWEVFCKSDLKNYRSLEYQFFTYLRRKAA